MQKYKNSLNMFHRLSFFQFSEQLLGMSVFLNIPDFPNSKPGKLWKLEKLGKLSETQGKCSENLLNKINSGKVFRYLS